MARRTRVTPGNELTLTSLKVHPKVFLDFQDASHKLLTLQSLVNRSMHLFVHNESFKNTILGYSKLLPSGSL